MTSARSRLFANQARWVLTNALVATKLPGFASVPRAIAFIPIYPNKLPTAPRLSRASRTWSKRIAVAVRRMMERRVANLYPNLSQ